MAVSSRENTGIDKAWEQMTAYENALVQSGEFLIKRSEQLRKWMWNNIKDRILEHFLSDHEIQKSIEGYEQCVVRGLVTPFVAADAILALFTKERPEKHI